MTPIADALLDAYVGEVSGERFFRRLLGTLDLTDHQARALAAFAELERVTGIRVAEHMTAQKIAIPHEITDRTDAALANHPITRWNDLMDYLDRYAPLAIDDFRPIATDASAQAIGDALIDHEIAYIAFVAADRAGDHDGALALICASSARIGG
jgi:hypothetical protein